MSPTETSMDHTAAINAAKEKFGKLIEEQLARVKKLKAETQWTDYSTLSPLIIGICPGDGIGPEIAKQSERVLTYFLKDKIAANKVELRHIDGLTIENRVKVMKAIPPDVLEQLKKCHVILKGPTTTPQEGDGLPNIESANVAMRKELDLFANIRPYKLPKEGIDWIFFRENTEGEYAVGSKGFDITEDLCVDFKMTTEQGTDRILRMGFDFAKKNGKKSVTIVTKSNVVKTTDGRFSRVAKRIAKEYEGAGIKAEEWYVDIISAKLIDPERRANFQVFICPNLYGDILTDEAAQVQGGVGTAGSANIGKKWAMFEAIHGSAPRMVKEGRTQYADPSSMIKAVAMLLRHIGYPQYAEKIEMGLDICGVFERKMAITGRSSGCTGEAFTNYLLDWLANPELESTWKSYVSKK